MQISGVENDAGDSGKVSLVALFCAFCPLLPLKLLTFLSFAVETWFTTVLAFGFWSKGSSSTRQDQGGNGLVLLLADDAN